MGAGAVSGMVGRLDETKAFIVPVRHFAHGRILTPNVETPYNALGVPNGGRRAVSSIPFETEPVQRFVDPDKSPVIAEVARAWHAARGHRSILAVIMSLGPQILGTLSLAFASEEPLPRESVELLKSLAQQGTLAIEFARVAEDGKRAAAARAIADERARMAGEIHDSLAQSFTSIALQSEALISQVDARSPIRATLGRIEETARQGLSEARASVLALRPLGDAPGELERALAQLAERCNIEGAVTCRLYAPATSRPLPAAVRDGVLRIAQEAVSNALRHARARQLAIALDVGEGGLVLVVRDDGVGLEDWAAQRGGGYGIDGMRARAEALGGRFSIERDAEGVGTVVRVELPPCGTS